MWLKIGADEKNRTSTALRQQASETCASTSSATSAREANFEDTNSTGEYQDSRCCWYSRVVGVDIAGNLAAVREKVDSAARHAGREPAEVTLVAVSKTHPPEMLAAAISAGVRVFGENKVQEAESKIGAIGRENVEWHLIGHLQSNKARKAVQLFDVIHTVDSIELASRLERISEEEGRKISVLVQVDLAGEKTKSGVPATDLDELAAYLRTCTHLSFDGLMILPPYFDDPAGARPFFRRIREIRDRLEADGMFSSERSQLSMGMSHDFEIAIEEGATLVRVGTAIFGSRS